MISLKESYDKVFATIESCNTQEHLDVASKMVENFKKMYKKFGYAKFLSYTLDRKLKMKLWSI
tara:strand:+ start:67 stop:255 length:189 start_codon:yes stop_codon:yes gene_type:complete